MDGKTVQGRTAAEIEEMEEEELGTFIDGLSDEERSEVEHMLRLDQDMGIAEILGEEESARLREKTRSEIEAERQEGGRRAA